MFADAEEFIDVMVEGGTDEKHGREVVLGGHVEILNCLKTVDDEARRGPGGGDADRDAVVETSLRAGRPTGREPRTEFMLAKNVVDPRLGGFDGPWPFPWSPASASTALRRRGHRRKSRNYPRCGQRMVPPS